MKLDRPPRVIPRSAIALAGGGFFDFGAPERSRFGIRDVAASLAKLCRFTGHTRRHYSVAEHSFHVSKLVPRELALAGLLHDAPEAFVGDVAQPLKALLPDYKAVEARVAAAVLGRFGLSAELAPEIKAADLAMLAAEKVQAMQSADLWPGLDGIEPAPVFLEFWTPYQAEGLFLARFRELTGEGAK